MSNNAVLDTISHFPRHISIIPDGNRTRAKKNWVSIFEWYLESVEKAIQIIEYIFSKTPIKVFSWWGMSTENRQKRPAAELDFLFSLYKTCGDRLDKFLEKEKINFRWIGNMEWLPQDFLDYMKNMVDRFSFDTDRYIIFAINYGGKDEIIRGIKSYLDKWNDVNDLTEDNLGDYMDLWSYNPVELVIRTKWDTSSRISGFMSRWIWYAELYFTSKLFQEMADNDIEQALVWYDSMYQYRNFGQ